MFTSRRQKARWTTSGEPLCRSEQAGRYARLVLVSSGHAAGPASYPTQPLMQSSCCIWQLANTYVQLPCLRGLAAKVELTCKRRPAT